MTDNFRVKHFPYRAAIIKNAAQVGEGTAGQSLKYAELAHEVASFAANRGYADGAVEEIKVTFEKTCEELDETGMESFNAAFMNGIIPLLDKAIEEGKYDEIKAQFEDAGAQAILCVLTRILAKYGGKDASRTRVERF